MDFDEPCVPVDLICASHDNGNHDDRKGKSTQISRCPGLTLNGFELVGVPTPRQFSQARAGTEIAMW